MFDWSSSELFTVKGMFYKQNVPLKLKAFYLDVIFIWNNIVDLWNILHIILQHLL